MANTICCYNATGTCYIPPLFVIPLLKTCDSLQKMFLLTLFINGPKEIFYQWLHHFSVINLSEEDPAWIILDNHTSHISVPIITFCRENHIVLLIIPPHTSHKMQQLDLTFFGPLKASFNRQCEHHLLHFEKVTANDIAQFFHACSCYRKTENGFRRNMAF